MESDNDETFLKRWSKKKIKRNLEPDSEVFAEEKNAYRISDTDSEDESDPQNLEGLSDTEILQKLGLKNPDELVEGDSFKEFMSKSVPEHLRKRALRKLWLSNPLLANLDGMNEYDEDFTIATSALQKFATNYVVGKGFLGQFSKDDLEIGNASDSPETLSSSSVRLTNDNSNGPNGSIGKVKLKGDTDQNESKNNLEDGEDSTIDVDGKNTHSLSSSDLDEYSEGAGSLAEQDIRTNSETNLSSRKLTRRMKFVYKSSKQENLD